MVLSVLAADGPGGGDAGDDGRGDADRGRECAARTEAPARVQHPFPLPRGRPQEPTRGQYLSIMYRQVLTIPLPVLNTLSNLRNLLGVSISVYV